MKLSVRLVVVSLLASAPALKAQDQSADSDVRGLPLVEIPAKAPGGVLAVFMTGDGGWASLDRKLCAELAAHGIAVVGLNSRDYLMHAKTPDEVGRDVARVSRHYMSLWKADTLVIAGYSRGSDLAPFAATRLPADLRSKLALIAMYGLSHEAGFEFHLIDLFASPHRRSDRPTLEELVKLKGTNMLCVYGADEKDSACRDAPSGLMQEVQLTGGHHFDDDFTHLGDLLLTALRGAH